MVSGQFPPKKIAPSPVRVTVWFRVMVRIRVGGGGRGGVQFSSGAIVLEPPHNFTSQL